MVIPWPCGAAQRHKDCACRETKVEKLLGVSAHEGPCKITVGSTRGCNWRIEVSGSGLHPVRPLPLWALHKRDGVTWLRSGWSW